MALFAGAVPVSVDLRPVCSYSSSSSCCCLSDSATSQDSLASSPSTVMCSTRTCRPASSQCAPMQPAPALANDEVSSADWKWDPAELRAAFGPRTRAVLLINPHNPTGKVCSMYSYSRIVNCNVHKVRVYTVHCTVQICLIILFHQTNNEYSNVWLYFSNTYRNTLYVSHV